MMKQIYFLVAMLLSVQATFAQTAISGKVLDASTKEALVGVTISSSAKSTISGSDGSFRIIKSGSDTIEITSIGFTAKKIALAGRENLGDIFLERSNMAMQEVVVTSNVAIDRRTPVAVSTLRSAAIEERIGNKEFPELLKTTPSTYVTKSGGGFGDSRINVRGFTQANVAVMINGVPVNDMENGAVYWSNWAGLSEIASNVQVQRGLGASKLSISAVGGNINIVTKATEIAKGGQASVMFGNDGYMKYSAGYSTGKSKKGLALSVLGSYTEGAGYVDGTHFRGYNYFATLGWEINSRHTISLTATGAPQWHNQRTAGLPYATLFGNPNDPSTVVRGIRYNDSWGTYKGKEFNWSNNYYHKPVANLNYYWKVSSKTDISAVLYASLGRGGGTGPIGSINGKTGFSLPKDANGQIRFDDIAKWNTGIAVPDFGSPTANTVTATGPYAGQYTASFSKGLIRRSSVNSHNWYGAIVNLTHNFTSSLAINAGIDLRYYKGIHNRVIDDGLGAVAYYETKDLNNPGKYVSVDDEDGTIDYYNDGLVKQAGGYLSVEYNKNKFTAFAAGSLSNTNYQRIEYFLYDMKTNPIYESAKKDFLGYVAKGGVSYRLTDKHSFFGNIGYFEKAPFFNIVFPNNNNTDLGRNLTNEKIFSSELGYGFRSKIFSVNVNVYRTEWKDKNFIRSFPDPSTGLSYRANIAGIVANHKGLELEATSRPINKLEVSVMGSIGDWRYKNNVTTDVYNDNNTLIQTVKIYTRDIKVGDAAQTTANLSAAYEVFKGFRVRGSYYYADDLYANFTPEGKTSPSSEGVQAWKLPSYGLLDGMMSYTFKVEEKKITFRLNVDNILNKMYIAESTDDTKYIPEGAPGYDPTDFRIGDAGSGKRNRLYPGFGRTWTISAKVNF